MEHKWWLIEFKFNGSVTRFLNKHDLKPGLFVPVFNSVSNTYNVWYYSDKQLVP